MKQLVPTSLDEYIAEHKPGDVVTGRMTDVSKAQARVELGEGIQATCRIVENMVDASSSAEARTDLTSLTSMLQAKWKGGGQSSGPARREPARAGQIRSFRIARLDLGAKKIEVELL